MKTNSTKAFSRQSLVGLNAAHFFLAELVVILSPSSRQNIRTLGREEQLEFLQNQMQGATRTSKQVWCIFDNTAYGYATANALEIASL